MKRKFFAMIAAGLALVAAEAMMAVAGAMMAPKALAGSCGGVETILINCDGAAGEEAFVDIFANVFHIASGMIAVVAAIGIVVVGIQYITARDNPEQMMKAKRRLFHIVIGLFVYVVLFAGIEFLLPGENKLITKLRNEAPAASEGRGSETETTSGTGDATDGSEPGVPERGSTPSGDEGWIDRLEES